MKLITLTNGNFAKVDDEDYEFLMQWRWRGTKSRSTYYATREQTIFGKNRVKKKKTVIMHRVLMDAYDLNVQIDHKDRDGLNNQKTNLRLCTQSQNRANTGLFKNNTSGFKGVWYRKERRKWAALLSHNGKKYRLGLFDNPEEAGKAYLKKAKEIYGEFAP